MKIDKINKIFTDKVAEYINAGWLINYQSMNGWSSNEIGKVDVTDGKTILRIKLEWDRHYDRKDCDDLDSVDFIRLRVYKDGNGSKPYEHILWDRWELVFERVFYGMPYSNKWYTEDVMQAQRAVEKWKSRNDYIRRYGKMNDTQRKMYFLFNGHYEYSEEVKRNLLPLVRRLPRCKTAHLEDIGRVYRDIQEHNGNRTRVYTISVKGNEHRIVV